MSQQNTLAILSRQGTLTLTRRLPLPVKEGEDKPEYASFRIVPSTEKDRLSLSAAYSCPDIAVLDSWTIAFLRSESVRFSLLTGPERLKADVVNVRLPKRDAGSSVYGLNNRMTFGQLAESLERIADPDDLTVAERNALPAADPAPRKRQKVKTAADPIPEPLPITEPVS